MTSDWLAPDPRHQLHDVQVKMYLYILILRFWCFIRFSLCCFASNSKYPKILHHYQCWGLPLVSTVNHSQGSTTEQLHAIITRLIIRFIHRLHPCSLWRPQYWGRKMSARSGKIEVLKIFKIALTQTSWFWTLIFSIWSLLGKYGAVGLFGFVQYGYKISTSFKLVLKSRNYFSRVLFPGTEQCPDLVVAIKLNIYSVCLKLQDIHWLMF